jgi:predicted ABC-type ATPase
VSPRPEGQIVVIAGVNGAGKSSLVGSRIRTRGLTYWNPDERTKRMLEADPELSLQDANSAAWHVGREILEEACESDARLLFETTLGGRTITNVLERAARSGKRIRMVYVGLDSVEKHIARVARRAAAGGHDIPEDRIRQRWERSLVNVIHLLPVLARLDLHDNSRDVEVGEVARPIHIMSYRGRRTHFKLPSQEVPAWAIPIVQAARNLEVL